MSVRALRLYERYGLISPHRTAKDWRLYGANDIARLNGVLVLKTLGLSLSSIADLFHADHQSAEPVRKGKIRLDPAHLRLRQPDQVTHGNASSRRHENHSNTSLRKQFNRP
jgi:DNA-binding transcriptional MerR regulator